LHHKLNRHMFASAIQEKGCSILNHSNLFIMSIQDRIKSLEKELADWTSNDVKSRFEQVGSSLHIQKIKELKMKIRKLKGK